MSNDIDKVMELYKEVNELCYQQIKKRNNSYISKVKQMVPKIDGFASFIFKRENIIVDDETYVMLTNELSAILKDIVNAIQNEDEVLMLDSLLNGLKKMIRAVSSRGRRNNCMKKTIFERNLEAWEQRFPENSVEINKKGMNIKIKKNKELQILPQVSGDESIILKVCQKGRELFLGGKRRQQSADRLMARGFGRNTPFTFFYIVGLGNP